MTRKRLPAVFMRGGTSKALVFHAKDLPRDQAEWDGLFVSAMGSPDPARRQLDGMGGGVSSLSKVCVVAPSSRDDADVDYMFAQILVDRAAVDYSGNCGNMSSAIGPFAIDEGLVRAGDGEALVRIHNTNTGKIIHSRFPVAGGRASTEGDLAIPGVAGSGAPVRLDFLQPGGATTGALLPTGNVIDSLTLADGGVVRVSMVDAANACVFVHAGDVGLDSTELPDALEAMPDVLRQLQAIREAASVAMGITPDLALAHARMLTPFVVVVAPPKDALTLDGQDLRAADADLTVRALSSGQPHRALPLTVSLCTAVAAKLTGSVVEAACRPDAGMPLRLAMPSGILSVGAEVTQAETGWVAERGMFFRTARRLFEGFVYC